MTINYSHSSTDAVDNTAGSPELTTQPVTTPKKTKTKTTATNTTSSGTTGSASSGRKKKTSEQPKSPIADIPHPQ